MRTVSHCCVISICAVTTSAFGASNLPEGIAAEAPPNAPAAAAPSAAPPNDAITAQDRPKSHLSSVSGPVSKDEDQWRLQYYGYFRAPMRVGIGRRDSPYPGQSKHTLHNPLVPDDQYLSWQHTNHARRDWAEMFFSYGNSWAKEVLAIQGYNFTDASYVINGTQFGIGQGWVEVTPPLPWENFRAKIKAGSFWNRYGQMGRYDAGEYDTYLFGRTHAMGETLRLEWDLPQQPLTLGIEHGLGVRRPDAQIYNAGRFTLLHHAHADLLYNESISASIHYLHSFSQEEARFTGPQPGWVYLGNSQAYMGIAQPDGKMTVVGADARFDMPDLFGYLYLGASYISLQNATTVAPAVEVIHSFGGGEFNMGITSNYLDSEPCRWGMPGSTCSNGNGNVLTLAGQYEAKLGDLVGPVFGERQDLTMKAYGMWNRVKSDDPMNDGMTKWKVGADLLFDAFPVLALGTRFDYLAPNSRIHRQNFMVLSPRIVFRSQLVTHEQIALQYSRYIYAKRECNVGTPSDIQRSGVSGSNVDYVPGSSTPWQFGPDIEELQCVQPPPSAVTPDGFGATTENQDPRQRAMPITGAHLRPDVNVITLEASMWW